MAAAAVRASSAADQAGQVGGKPPRVRDATRGMTPDQKRAYFSEGGKGRELYPADVCKEQLRIVGQRQRQRDARKTAYEQFLFDKASKDCPNARRSFFASDEAKRACGSAVCNEEMERLAIEYEALVNEVPSDRWRIAADCDGDQFPPGKFEPPPPHGARMIMSTVSGRYTPPNNLSDEDRLDQMTPGEALDYKGPSSCGAVVGISQL